ncbi:MAG: hypothetical protein ACTH0Y_04215 [Luteimonas sp.]
MKRMVSQGGVILSSPGRPEEDEIREVGRDIRTAQKLLWSKRFSDAHSAWNSLPEPMRDRLAESGIHASGQALGGVAGSHVLVYGISNMLGMLSAQHSSLRPFRPRIVAASRFTLAPALAAAAVQGATVKYLQMRNKVFDDIPGSWRAWNEVRNNVLYKSKR